MNAWDVLMAGIAPDHLPALIVAAVVLGALTGWSATPRGRRLLAGLTGADRAAALLLAGSAAVHLALPLGHHDEAGLVLGFVGSGLGYGWLAAQVVRRRRWRLLAAALVVATLLGYLSVVGSGAEGPDQVGILTGLDELLVLGLAATPPARAPLRSRMRRVRAGLATAGSLAALLVFGASVWGVAWAAPPMSTSTGDTADLAAGPAARLAAVPQEHGHGHSSQAEAGMIALSDGVGGPTAAEQSAAADLARRTATAMTRYADIRRALAAGYRPTLTREGLAVHLERPHAPSAVGLDPTRPPLLMYAVEHGRATLLSAVYTAPLGGELPAGGAGLHWHTHNGCVSLLPPGLGIASLFGDCPLLSVQATLPLMAHVWVVEPPGGALADQVDDAWVSAYNRDHGVTFTW